MRKTTFLKTLLVAACLCLGSMSVWADGWSVNFGTIISAEGLSDKAEVLPNTPAAATIGGTSMGTMTLGETNVNTNLVFQTSEKWLARTGGYIHNQSSGGRAFAIRNCTANQTITLVTGNASITAATNATQQSASSGTYVYKVTANGDVKFSHDRYLFIYRVTVEDPSATEADYTVAYVDEEKNSLKSSSTYSGETGADATISDADKVEIWVDGVKYVYKEDDAEGKTIASDGSTVVTVTFRVANTYSYTLNAVDAANEKDLIKQIANNNAAYEGSTYYERGEKAFYEDGVLYSTSWSGGFEVSFTEASTKNIPYTKNTTWAYYTEIEDMTVSGSWAANGNYPAFYSRGTAKRFGKGAYAYTAPFEVGGTYTVTMWARNNSASQTSNVGLYTRDSEGNLTTTGKAFDNWSTAERAEHTVENVVIPSGCSFAVKNESTDYTSNLEMDYIYFVKTAEAVTVSDADYATYVSANDLDFTDTSIKAYTAKVNASTGEIVLSNLNKVPANTPVILYKDGGATENIPFAASTDAVGDNDLLVGTGAAVATGTNPYNYILNNVSGIGFYKAAGQTVATNRAYLQTTYDVATPGARMVMVFADEETTGIADVRGKMEDGRSGYFDLQGRQVAQPTKGLYIVNGKKVVIK